MRWLFVVQFVRISVDERQIGNALFLISSYDLFKLYMEAYFDIGAGI